MNGWLNFYKPIGISSAKLVFIVKKLLGGTVKVGHAGTLDVEAEGILPLAIGEATKLVKYLVDAVKEYEFEIKFGAQTDTGDASGKVIKITDKLPDREQCINVCSEFIGTINQVPPAFSALKINGQRAYNLARKRSSAQNSDDHIKIQLKARQIQIYDLELLEVDEQNNIASYRTTCSKGTYIRTLAEDIALSLQSLGFVIKLRRTRVGMFSLHNALYLADLEQKREFSNEFLHDKIIETEAILDDIPVLDITEVQATKIRYGQICVFEHTIDQEKIWLRHKQKLVAIGYISANCFKSQRVFNLT